MPLGCLLYWYSKHPSLHPQEFWRIIHEHIQAVQIGNIYSPIGKHIVKAHNYHVPGPLFWALEHVSPDARGGAWNKRILQRESRWIYNLKATFPPGLNNVLSYRPFLDNFISGKTERLM